MHRLRFGLREKRLVLLHILLLVLTRVGVCVKLSGYYDYYYLSFQSWELCWPEWDQP